MEAREKSEQERRRRRHGSLTAADEKEAEEGEGDQEAEDKTESEDEDEDDEDYDTDDENDEGGSGEIVNDYGPTTDDTFEEILERIVHKVSAHVCLYASAAFLPPLFFVSQGADTDEELIEYCRSQIKELKYFSISMHSLSFPRWRPCLCLTFSHH
jgi:hypothetical protein